jgi:hypothetical protein
MLVISRGTFFDFTFETWSAEVGVECLIDDVPGNVAKFSWRCVEKG